MKTGTAQINGVEMFYETDGSGEPLLLLHGGGGCHEDWVHALGSAKRRSRAHLPGRQRPICSDHTCVLSKIGLRSYAPVLNCSYRVFPLTIFARQAYSLRHQLSFDSVVGDK
jgi:pimeloyl-ACP methyl ester carboxylesterase